MILLMNALQGVIDLDTDIFLSINRMHNAFFDYFMSAYSGKWEWIPLYAALLYVIVRNFSWKVALMCTIGVALTITFADQVCATVMRPYFERLRPSNLDNPLSELVHIVNDRRGGRYGFPSCHASNTFGLAFFIFFLFRRKWLTLFMMAWALLTCYSRIYLGVHYPGDLLVGTIVGAAGAWLVYYLLVKVGKYKCPKYLQQVNVPVWIGLLSIAGMLIYAGIMSFFSPIL